MLASIISRRVFLQGTFNALTINKTNVTEKLWGRIDEHRQHIPIYSKPEQPMYYREVGNGKGEYVISSKIGMENLEARVPSLTLGLAC